MNVSKMFSRSFLTLVCLSSSFTAFADWSSPVYSYERTTFTGTTSGNGSGSAAPVENDPTQNSISATASWTAPSTMPANGGASAVAEGTVTATFTWSGGTVPSTVQYRGTATGSVSQSNSSGAGGGSTVFASPGGISFNLSAPTNKSQSYTGSWSTQNTDGNTLIFTFGLKSTAGGGTYAPNGSASSSSSVSASIELG